MTELEQDLAEIKELRAKIAKLTNKLDKVLLRVKDNSPFKPGDKVVITVPDKDKTEHILFVKHVILSKTNEFWYSFYRSNKDGTRSLKKFHVGGLSDYTLRKFQI